MFVYFVEFLLIVVMVSFGLVFFCNNMVVLLFNGNVVLFKLLGKNGVKEEFKLFGKVLEFVGIYR